MEDLGKLSSGDVHTLRWHFDAIRRDESSSPSSPPEVGHDALAVLRFKCLLQKPEKPS
jgi:hypothetical protein